MRTTIDIDDDVLRAAKALARARKITAGRMISDLARRGLQARASRTANHVRGGFALLPKGGRPVTPADVDSLLEDT
ncbi:MAG: hypothetical protein SFV21_14915 [Rhodospirillaceae bacterium]|nr:hypothetical protein [Rhodospirillaceae bacterium]